MVDVAGVIRDQDGGTALRQWCGFGLEAMDDRTVGGNEVPEEGEESAELRVSSSPWVGMRWGGHSSMMARASKVQGLIGRGGFREA